MLELQRSGGNQAVVALLSRAGPAPRALLRQQTPRAAPVCAPAPTRSGGSSTDAGQACTTHLESPHGEVHHRPVPVVGADLQARLERHEHVVPSLRRGSEETQRDERAWYAERGAMGWAIDLVNSEDETDPARWDAVLTRWDEARDALRSARAVEPTAERINDAGQRGQEALLVFQDAAEQSRLRREEYARYLAGFTHAAQGVHATAVVVRDVSFAAAVGLAVVVAAPVVAGGVAAFGTGTLGMTAGSTSLAAFTYGGTALGMGALGAGIEGSGQVLGTLGAQAATALSDLMRGSSTAADAFDLTALGDAGWEGMRRGFVDGVLAFAGAQAERVLASHASAAVRSLLGPGNSSLSAVLLRRTLTRALSGGASGGVVGALQAGYRAAAEGQDLAGIARAMEYGFAIGAGAGTALGAAGGAIEARAADGLRRRVAALLRERVAASPGSLADDVLVSGTLDRLRANPTAGENQRILDLTPRVWQALHDPDGVASAVSEIWLEEHLLGLMAPRAAADRYGQAAMVLARRRGAPVVVLPRGQEFSSQQFFDQVVVRGNRFLDLSVLDVSEGHGASTHLIQDLAVDRVLRGTGLRAEQYRALLEHARGPDGARLGNDLWIELYDSLTGRINDPNAVYPAIREAIPVP